MRPKRLAPSFASVLLLALALPACSLTMPVGAVAPRPTIHLGSTRQRLALVLSPAISAAPLSLDCGSACTVRVTDVHASLAHGFDAGFRPFYTLVREDADLTLRFESLTVELDREQRMLVRYAVHLDARDGRTVGRSFGTMHGSRIGFHPESVLTEVLTRVFEEVASDCFLPLSIDR